MLHGFGPSFDPKVIMDKARKTTGLQDFQDDTGTFALGLSKLCESLQQEANLNFVGKMMTRAQLDITVENRLKIAQATSSVPIPLTQPVFVVGMPRSGTTFLHNLLSLDDETFRAPRLWEIVDPLPVPETGTWLTSWRLFKSHMGTLVFQYLAPNFASVHPVGSLQAEECMPILSLSMLSFQFYTMMNVPGYNDWLMPRSQMEALLWHKRFLQAVTTKRQHQRWLLKAPWHMNHLDELLTVYPDAKVIVPHRTPEGMLASLSSLHARLFAMTSDELDLTGLGNYTRQVWEQILGKFMAARTQLPPHQVLDLQFGELHRDPIGAVKKVYAFLGVSLPLAAQTKMEMWLANDVKLGKLGANGVHEYDASWFGLSDDDTLSSATFREYKQRYI